MTAAVAKLPEEPEASPAWKLLRSVSSAGSPGPIPKIEPYSFDEKLLRDFAVGVKLATPVLLVGPPGCGKTSLPQQVAARLGIPFARVNCDGELRRAHLVGQWLPEPAEGGGMSVRWHDSTLVQAVRHGWWLVLDELDAASPAVTMVLQSLLEPGRRMHLAETSDTIEAHPRFRVFATGNTFGERAVNRASHAGTLMQNAAFVDRFGMVLSLDYPSCMEELARIALHVPEASDPDLRDYYLAIAHCAAELRKDKSFKTDLSTRRLIQWARLMPFYDHDLIATSEAAIVRKFTNPADAGVFRAILRRVGGYA